MDERKITEDMEEENEEMIEELPELVFMDTAEDVVRICSENQGIIKGVKI